MSSLARRLLVALVALVVGATLLGAAPASAGQPAVGVQMVDNHYLPSTAAVGQGQPVRFTNFGQVVHDARDRSGLEAFDTGYVSSPDSAIVGPLPGAGEYRYYCTFHPEMVGRLRVPVTTNRSQVPARTAVTVRWAATRAPAGLVFDVQRRRPGTSRFVDWRVDAEAAATRWWPATAGTWAIRARVSTSDGTDASAWSPVRTVRVT
jgi:plastocyanin